MPGTVVQIDCAKIRDWESFHEVFAVAFGFPAFYGKNMNAWIDYMDSLDKPEDLMSTVHAGSNGVLTLQLENVKAFSEHYPDLYTAIIECSAVVNHRRLEVGEPSVLALSFRI
jgi:RNAse (barnase) inhibitor barstar